MNKMFEHMRFAEGICVGVIFSICFSFLVEKEIEYRYEKINVVKIESDKSEIIKINHDKRQIQCLAETIYFEAGNQTVDGKIAVGNVVMNRVDDNKFPSTPCEVVKQKRKKVCQFSFFCENKKIKDMKIFNSSKEIANKIYYKKIEDNTFGATFYHANYVKPYWSNKFKKTTQIEDHIFYRG